MEQYLKANWEEISKLLPVIQKAHEDFRNMQGAHLKDFSRAANLVEELENQVMFLLKKRKRLQASII